MNTGARVAAALGVPVHAVDEAVPFANDCRAVGDDQVVRGEHEVVHVAGKVEVVQSPALEFAAGIEVVQDQLWSTHPGSRSDVPQRTGFVEFRVGGERNALE